MESKEDLINAMNSVLGNVTGDLCNKVIPFNKCTNFTFQKPPNKKTKRISICPNSITTSVDGIKITDISLESNGLTQGFDAIISKIPKVQIREYQFDARMHQIFNSFAAFSSGLKNGFNAVVRGKDLKDKCFGALKQIFTTISEQLGAVCQPSTDVFKLAKAGDAYYDNNNIISNPVFKIPFCMYYQIMSSKDTGTYVLPFNGSKLIDAGDNPSSSWGNGGKGGASGTSSQSLLGTILNFVGANIYIPFQPLWQGAGAGSPFPQIEIKFNLFNDTRESAVNNYIFVNTIIPKNKFMQYHIFQQNPCVYDVKIDGVGRFFMCSANINCTYKGVMREVSKKILGDIRLSSNPLYDGNTIINQAKYIPDVYEFSITFESLLPNNLNNHLYRFTTVKDPCETKAFSGLSDKMSQKVDEAVKNAAVENKIGDQ